MALTHPALLTGAWYEKVGLAGQRMEGNLQCGMIAISYQYFPAPNTGTLVCPDHSTLPLLPFQMPTALP